MTIMDTGESASYVAFADQDLDMGEVGGEVTWNMAGNSAAVAWFAIYFATDAVGANRSRVGSDLPAVARMVNVSADTPIASWTHVAFLSGKGG